MKSKKLEIVKGSGNVFRDLGHKHADADQFLLTGDFLNEPFG